MEEEDYDRPVSGTRRNIRFESTDDIMLIKKALKKLNEESDPRLKTSFNALVAMAAVDEAKRILGIPRNPYRQN